MSFQSNLKAVVNEVWRVGYILDVEITSKVLFDAESLLIKEFQIQIHYSLPWNTIAERKKAKKCMHLKMLRINVDGNIHYLNSTHLDFYDTSSSDLSMHVVDNKAYRGFTDTFLPSEMSFEKLGGTYCGSLYWFFIEILHEDLFEDEWCYFD